MKSVLIYTTHKAASMFLHKLTKNIAAALDIHHYSVNYDEYYNVIKKQSSWKEFIEDASRCGCFGPIRAAETKENFPSNLQDYSIILHLRDPRDVLTSLFFSHTYSHTRKEGQFNPDDEQRKQWEVMGIDAFVLEKVPAYKERYESLTSTPLVLPHTQLVKYEDMVTDYPTWLKQYLSAFSHLDSTITLAVLHQQLLEKFKNEFTPPENEDVYRHKRKIKPGDHKDKLKPETIAILNREFSDILDLLTPAKQ